MARHLDVRPLFHLACHLGIAEDDTKEPVLPTQLGCCEMACKCSELIDEVLHGVEGGFPKMVSSGADSILTLTISVMEATVVVVATMVAPFVRYK